MMGIPSAEDARARSPPGSPAVQRSSNVVNQAESNNPGARQRNTVIVQIPEAIGVVHGTEFQFNEPGRRLLMIRCVKSIDTTNKDGDYPTLVLCLFRYET